MLLSMSDILSKSESPEDKRERLRIKTLPEARIEQLNDAYRRQHEITFSEGDLVMPTRDSGLNETYIGEPHKVLLVRAVGSHECDWDTTVYVATVDADGGIQAAWFAAWRFEPYVAKEA